MYCHQTRYSNNSVTFSGLNSLLISGNPDSNTVIDCSLSTIDAGITLEKIANLTLKNLTLTSCGLEHSFLKEKKSNIQFSTKLNELQ